MLRLSNKSKIVFETISFVGTDKFGDPWHFGADRDPRIRTSDEWIRIQLRIRLLSSVTLSMQKIYYFDIFSYNLPTGTLSSVLKINLQALFHSV